MTDILSRYFIYNLRNLTFDEYNLNIYIRRCLLDYISCLLCGRKVVESFNSFSNNIFSDALRFGFYAHTMELDDGHRRGAIHVGATIFSALLAVAVKEKISSKDFLFGAIIGYEATIRLACAVQPGNKLRGYHATGTCGTVGAALGVAMALHFTEEQMMTTLSAAVTSAAGILEMQEDDSDLKPYNVGRAAMDAVAAVYIGKTGFKGPIDPLGGKRGFLHVMTDTPHPEFLTDFNSKTLCIEQIYQKTYAACRHAHPAIEASMKLKEKYKIQPTSVREICVQTYRLAVEGHDHIDIPSISSAKMSIPYCVALALCQGNTGMSNFNEENLRNPEILDLTRKVKVVEDETLSTLVPEKRASIVKISLLDGSSFSFRVDYPKGEPENPLSNEELEQKFYSLAMANGLMRERCEHILTLIKQPDFNVNELLALCIN